MLSVSSCPLQVCYILVVIRTQPDRENSSLIMSVLCGCVENALIVFVCLQLFQSTATIQADHPAAVCRSQAEYLLMRNWALRLRLLPLVRKSICLKSSSVLQKLFWADRCQRISVLVVRTLGRSTLGFCQAKCQSDHMVCWTNHLETVTYCLIHMHMPNRSEGQRLWSRTSPAVWGY